MLPICPISVAVQQEINDPIKVIKYIKKFTWIMAKLLVYMKRCVVIVF